MRWTEIWKRVQQDRKDRDLVDHAAILEAFPDPAARKSFLTYKKSGKIRAIKTIAGQIAGQARNSERYRISCFHMISMIVRIGRNN
jgi:hypothetical protein